MIGYAIFKSSLFLALGTTRRQLLCQHARTLLAFLLQRRRQCSTPSFSSRAMGGETASAQYHTAINVTVGDRQLICITDKAKLEES
jgi:hypothetical protein